jgi:hypothetical protein
VDDRPGRDRPLFRTRNAQCRNPAIVRFGQGIGGRLLPRLCRINPGEGRTEALQHRDPGRTRRQDYRPLP